VTAQPAAFSSRTIFWLIAVGLAAFGGAAYFVVFGDDPDAARTPGANAYSHSAIGHRAFVETLRRQDIPVLVSRGDSAAKAGRSAMLVVAEPSGRAGAEPAIEGLLQADSVLLVLPKWRGRPDPAKPRWVESVAAVPRAEVERILGQVTPGASIKRLAGPASWSAGTLDVTPTLARPQLMQAPRLRAVVAADQGLLVGELVRGERRIWVLSDPDVLSNHGLGRGDNAELALRLVEALRPTGGAVIVDETVHGFRNQPNLFRAMFELPLVVATIQIAAAIIALMWAATGRFGAPVPAERSLQAGKATLVGSVAGLLQYGGHGGEILRRYLGVTLRDVARQLHAPRNLDGAALIEWVDRVGDAHGVRAKFESLCGEAEAIAGRSTPDRTRLAQSAEKLYRWKQEIIHGPGGHRFGQPQTPGAGRENGNRSGRRP